MLQAVVQNALIMWKKFMKIHFFRLYNVVIVEKTLEHRMVVPKALKRWLQIIIPDMASGQNSSKECLRLRPCSLLIFLVRNFLHFLILPRTNLQSHVFLELG